MIDEWFTSRKCLALNIMWSGTYLGGTVVPFLFQILLNKYGFRAALGVWSIILVSLLKPP